MTKWSQLLFMSSTVREGGEGRAEMVVRVQAQDQSWVWLYMVLQLQPGEIPVSSNNYIIRLVLTTLIHFTKRLKHKTKECLVSPAVTLRPGQSVNSSAQSRPNSIWC